MLLIDGEPQVQQLQLAVVPVQHVPPRSAIPPSAPHVLAQAVEGGALLGVPLGVIAVRVLDVVLQRGDPVDLVRRLHRRGYHGRLRHCDDGGQRPADGVPGKAVGACRAGCRGSEPCGE